VDDLAAVGRAAFNGKPHAEVPARNACAGPRKNIASKEHERKCSAVFRRRTVRGVNQGDARPAALEFLGAPVLAA
jgi:hypothetical protein